MQTKNEIELLVSQVNFQLNKLNDKIKSLEARVDGLEKPKRRRRVQKVVTDNG
tara:strand:- start:1782 stop:1940 length:159 start_codon:yes stop_codon:yes gene_type:complete